MESDDLEKRLIRIEERLDLFEKVLLESQLPKEEPIPYYEDEPEQLSSEAVKVLSQYDEIVKQKEEREKEIKKGFQALFKPLED